MDVKRILCVILISPLVAIFAVVVLPFFLIFAALEALNWIIATAFGWEYVSISDSDW